jgi:glycosyltransferase involved in cell wall biosynthesis
MTVGAVVPAYDEEGYVGDVVDDIPDFVDRAYVIDDGSTDETWAEIRRHAADRNGDHDGAFDDRVVPIRHPENRGVGGAIKTGYLRAREEELDATVVLGGDDQMDPEAATRYLDPIAEGVADYAKGNRFLRRDDWAEMPRFRFVGNLVLSTLTKVASGYWDLSDSQNGYTAISLSALRRTDVENMYEYYGYCNDLLVRLNTADVRVADVPRSSAYAYSDGWKSHIDYTEYVPRVSAMLVRSFCRRLGRKYLLTGYDVLAPLYAVGAAGMVGGAVGALARLQRRDGQAGAWVLATLVGALAFLAATVRDQRDNRDLQVQFEQAEEGDGRQATAATAAPAARATDQPTETTEDSGSRARKPATDGDGVGHGVRPQPSAPQSGRTDGTQSGESNGQPESHDGDGIDLVGGPS